MIDPLFNFKTIPAGSILMAPEANDNQGVDQLRSLPSSLQKMLASERTGAYIRGLTKTYDVPLEQAPQIAFMVLQIAVGEKPLGQLGGMLSSELKLANDKAQKMAQEIEKELFGPVMLEFNKYLQDKKAMKPGVMDKMRVAPQNVLNLKEVPKPPAAPLPPAAPKPPLLHI